jgi:hypothetical protein
MIFNPFRYRTGAAISAEADVLETRYGAAGAVRRVREQIAQADRDTRQHLYRVHDEIVRRHPSAAPA